MTKEAISTEALKLAFKQAFDLGQTYCSWEDSEYPSHWKKADAAKERFNHLVEDTIRELLAEQQTDWEAVAADQAMTIALLKAEQPAPATELREQEPVAWALYQRGRLHSFWLDKGDAYDFEFTPDHQWKPLYTSPPTLSLAQRQRSVKPLTAEEAGAMYNTFLRNGGAIIKFVRAIEAAHGIKGDA